MDNARLLLQRFAQAFPQEGNNHHLAYARTRNENLPAYNEVIARSAHTGQVPPIMVGEEFRYRYQLILAGLHNQGIRGICYNVDTGRATALVIKYPSHNFPVNDGRIYVGGEGGSIADAHIVGHRVLEHQRFTVGNRSMSNTLQSRNPIRLMVYSDIAPGGNNIGDNPNNLGYTFVGLYTVREETLVETELGLIVYEYLLTPPEGSKEPFDCAVCLCEFSEHDKLRLLPLCSHAFHIDCIESWLLSNSTCPLCRGTLFSPGFSVENSVFDFNDSRIDEDGFSGSIRIGFLVVKSQLITIMLLMKRGLVRTCITGYQEQNYWNKTCEESNVWFCRG